MSNAGWSEDRVTTLSKLWLDGLSASQIARQLGGVTRNAVIGKVHRLGLPDRSTAQSRKAAPSSRLPRPPLHARPVRRTGQAAPTLHSPPSVPEATGLVKNLIHLGVHACKWPIGDPRSVTFAFCGAHAEGRYCAGHERLATRPRKAADPSTGIVRRALAGFI